MNFIEYYTMASKEFINELPKSITMDDDICCICHDTLSEDNLILPCLHKFCKSEILQWFENNYTCPTCRSEFPVDKKFCKSCGKIHYESDDSYYSSDVDSYNEVDVDSSNESEQSDGSDIPEKISYRDMDFSKLTLGSSKQISSNGTIPILYNGNNIMFQLPPLPDYGIRRKEKQEMDQIEQIYQTPSLEQKEKLYKIYDDLFSDLDDY